MPLIKQRVERFSDVAPLAGFFISGMPPYRGGFFEHKVVNQESAVKILQFIAWAIETLPEWRRRPHRKTANGSGRTDGIQDSRLPVSLFIAIAGTSVSTSVIDSMAVIGKDMTRARLRHAIEVLGGVSKKGAKKLESEFRASPLIKKGAQARETIEIVDREGVHPYNARLC